MIVSADTDAARCHQEIADRTKAHDSRMGCIGVIAYLLHSDHRCTFTERQCCECRPVAVTDLRRARRTSEFITARQDRNARSGREEELTHPARVDHRKERRISDCTNLRERVSHLHILASPSNMRSNRLRSGKPDLLWERGRASLQ